MINVSDTFVSEVGMQFESSAYNGTAVASQIAGTWTSIEGATWIWPTFIGSDFPINVPVSFTKTFILSGYPDTSSIIIAADDNFDIILNGIRIASVDSSVTPWNETRSYDTTSSLLEGENKLSITVSNAGGASGLLFRLNYSYNIPDPIISNPDPYIPVTEPPVFPLSPGTESENPLTFIDSLTSTTTSTTTASPTTTTIPTTPPPVHVFECNSNSNKCSKLNY